MLRFFYKQMRKKGFTLVELIVVVAIIGVLAAILVPTMWEYYTRSKIQTANATASEIKNIISVFMAEMDLQKAGMKQGSNINAQIMFMVQGGEWIVKAECKVSDGKGHDVTDSNGSKTFFDHTKWWKNNMSMLLLDTTTRYDEYHLLAMCRAVADCCKNLDTGFIMAFFSSGVCRGVVYMPDCNYLWPGNNSEYNKLPTYLTENRPRQRPRLVYSQRVEGKQGYPALKEFSPWWGTWPASADGTIWDGRAGIDKDGYFVGTSPVIEYKDK